MNDTGELAIIDVHEHSIEINPVKFKNKWESPPLVLLSLIGC